MQVRDIMTSDARIIGPDTMVREAARAMRAGNVGALPVGENDRLIGMVTDRDIVVRAVADELPPGKTTVRDVMSRGICYVFDDDDLEQAAGRHAGLGRPGTQRCRGLAEGALRRLRTLGPAAALTGAYAPSVQLDSFPRLPQAGDHVAAQHVEEASRLLKPGGTFAILNYS
mgnify:CR=1 FL=1